MISVAIVEDERKYQDVIRDCLHKYDTENPGVRFMVDTNDNPVAFLDSFASQYDMVLLDIDMPYMNGMDLATRLREKDKNFILIFITNLARFALKGYEVDAMDYILKPLNYPSFALKLRKAMTILERNPSDKILVGTKTVKVSLRISDIIYVEIRGHNLTYVTTGGESHSYGTMANVEKLLPKKSFAKCNSCHLVNLNYVRKIEGFTCYVDKYALSISRMRKTPFMEALSSFLMLHS